LAKPTTEFSYPRQRVERDATRNRACLQATEEISAVRKRTVKYNLTVSPHSRVELNSFAVKDGWSSANMKRQLFRLLILVLFAFSVTAQNKEARQIDEFGRIPCGDFLARMNALFIELQNSPDSKIYVVYYGGRYRRTLGRTNGTGGYNAIKLEYAHRDDGMNWAKSIPLYLSSETAFPVEFRNSLKDRIVLLNGGFRENTEVEIWIVPENVEPPKPTPTITEKDVKFRKDKPFRTPAFINCYNYAKAII
jgi:hypothetical protein